MKCKCGNRLNLGTEVSSGVCGNCSRGIEHRRLDSLSDETRQKMERLAPKLGSVTESSSVTGSVTKQQKYRAKNADKTTADSAKRMALWRQRKRHPELDL